MIRLGILDFDTSHCVEFTKRLNHQGIAEDQWVNGARVVVGYPGTSRITPPEQILAYQKEMEKLGVHLVSRPEDMIGKVDGMLIESVEGGMHWTRAQPFLEAGVPCFVDKPFSCSVDDALRLVDLAAKKKVAIFSSSSLRYAPEIVQFLEAKDLGKVHGAFAYGPAPLHERNPGLYHYGIHSIELLYTVMGPGCEHVTCTHEKDVDLVTGQWENGRVASVRGIRSGNSSYGCVVFAERRMRTVPVDSRYIYRELLKKIVEMFETGKSPLDIRVTVEIIGFIEAALASANNHGMVQKVRVSK
jgi:predicted dehydrogenase